METHSNEKEDGGGGYKSSNFMHPLEKKKEEDGVVMSLLVRETEYCARVFVWMSLETVSNNCVKNLSQ